MTFHDLAARYADDPDEAAYIAALAEERLAARLRRSGTVCDVCDRRFVSAHRDAKLCSDACEQRRRRREGRKNSG